MIAVIQRVKKASVAVPRKTNTIGAGLLILIGVRDGDTPADARLLAEKTRKLRIMPDSDNKMNLTISQTDSELLVISQFTLLGDVSKGNRPSFAHAAAPETAQELYHLYIDHMKEAGIPISTGFFGENMQVTLINDGPTTIILDTQTLKK